MSFEVDIDEESKLKPKHNSMTFTTPNTQAESSIEEITPQSHVEANVQVN